MVCPVESFRIVEINEVNMGGSRKSRHDKFLKLQQISHSGVTSKKPMLFHTDNVLEVNNKAVKNDALKDFCQLYPSAILSVILIQKLDLQLINEICVFI